MRQSGRLPPAEAPARHAMDTSGLNKLDSQDVGQHLDDQQKLMLDAFRSGKSGERNHISASKARKLSPLKETPQERLRKDWREMKMRIWKRLRLRIYRRQPFPLSTLVLLMRRR
ncbi:unnamed protein product [Brassica oleracea]